MTPPTPPKGDPRRGKEVAERLGSQAATGWSAVQSFYRSWQATKQPQDILDQQRRAAIAAHTTAVTKYRAKASGLRSTKRMGQITAASGAGVAAVSMANASDLTPLGIAAAATGVVITFVSGRRLKRLQPPPPPMIPPAASAPLQVGTPGADQAARITEVRRQLATMLPTVAALQPEAAYELQRVDVAAAPATEALIERIRLLRDVQLRLPDSEPGRMAAVSIQSLAANLRRGAATYEELLAAVVALLSSPDPRGSTDDMLRPSIAELQAYTAGLQRVADTW